MESISKRSKLVEAVNPLEHNKDILFSVFCFLSTNDLARAAAVSRAWRRASGTEGLWRRKCEEAGVGQLPNETWRASFQLCQPQWRDWKLKQLEADITRLAALPLQVVYKQRDWKDPGTRKIRGLGQLRTLQGLLATEDAVGSWTSHDFVRLVKMQFVSDTDFVPGSNWAEARVILNDKIECRHLSEWSWRYSSSSVFQGSLFCIDLPGGELLTQEEFPDCLANHLRGSNVFALVYKHYKHDVRFVKHNIQVLMDLLNVSCALSAIEFVRVLSQIGTPEGTRWLNPNDLYALE
jgi:hypothetical protein